MQLRLKRNEHALKKRKKENSIKIIWEIKSKYIKDHKKQMD